MGDGGMGDGGMGDWGMGGWGMGDGYTLLVVDLPSLISFDVCNYSFGTHIIDSNTL
jgi:hypothetical protein